MSLVSLADPFVMLRAAHYRSIGIPSGILFICFVCCLFSALGSGNHAGLAEASGPSNFTPLLASPRGRKHSLGDALMAVIANPFVLITLLFSGGIALASVTLQRFVSIRLPATQQGQS